MSYAPLTARRTAVAGLLGLLVLAAPTAAHAQEPVEPATGAPAPAELEITLSGPATGTSGGTGSWSIAVSNVGSTDAGEVRVALVLPDGVDVASVGATDQWACVLSPMSCSLEGGLAAGQSAQAIPVVLAYDAAGRHELAADAYQGEDPGAGLQVVRGTATVDVAPAPAPPAAAPAPAAGAAPAQAAQQPAAPAAKTTAEPVAAPPAEAGQTAAPAEQAPAETVELQSAEQPETLPFTDEGLEPVSAPATDDGSGAPVLLLLAAGAVLLGGGAVVVRMMHGRGLI